MSEATSDEGVIAVLIERLEKQRLPRLLALEEKVNNGEPLASFDIEYLENAIADAHKVFPLVESLVERHPEYQSLASKVIGLYKEIAGKALEIEKRQGNNNN